VKKAQEEKTKLELRVKDLENTIRNYEEKIVPSLQDRLKTEMKFHMPGDSAKKITVELDTNKVLEHLLAFEEFWSSPPCRMYSTRLSRHLNIINLGK
jgi:hypothetical protein